MAETSLVEPLMQAPDRPTIELFARLGGGDSIAKLLARSGVSYAEAGQATVEEAASKAIEGAANGAELAAGHTQKMEEAVGETARDAKEATEEATRRIAEMTRGAAETLKEVGREAVESVRRQPQETPQTTAGQAGQEPATAEQDEPGEPEPADD